MSGADQARVAIAVAAPVERAFAVFVEEIDLWWRRGPRFRHVRGDRGLMAIEPRAGGRVFESIVSDGQERVIEIGRVTAWEPPHRLRFDWRNSTFKRDERTEVEVTFEARGAGTLVTVTHRGWGQIRADHPARHGQDDVAFLRRLGLWWTDLLRGFERRL
jgi:uncharacterized protein YndB with AHSA1/START domain